MANARKIWILPPAAFLWQEHVEKLHPSKLPNADFIWFTAYSHSGDRMRFSNIYAKLTISSPFTKES